MIAQRSLCALHAVEVAYVKLDRALVKYIERDAIFEIDQLDEGVGESVAYRQFIEDVRVVPSQIRHNQFAYFYLGREPSEDA